MQGFFPKKEFLFLILSFVLLVQLGYSQSMNDIQNVKVDNLSDAQVEQLIKRAESAGMNESQLEAYAREKGMPANEVAKLRERIQQLRSGGRQGQQQARPGQQQGQIRQVAGFNMDPALFDSIRRADPYYDLTPEQKKIFGYKLFHNRNLTFSPSLNIPTPGSYVIGSGDQLIIDVYGASQQSYELTVNPEGRIMIPNLGPISVGGSSVDAARQRIKQQLGGIYSGLLGSNPNTFLEIRLGNIRSISVSIVGELVKPGTYTLPSFASVFNALFAAGGPNENGTFRNIQVYRDSKLLGELDVYDFLTKGEHGKNVTLRDNDVIIVQPYKNRVELKGPVRREGYFEMKPDESVADLINFAGGFSSLAYRERLTIRRATGEQMKVNDLNAEEFNSFTLQDGDEITVGERLNRFENRVQISGAVFRPGEFSIPVDGMGVKALVEKAEGLRGDAFGGRAILYRTKEDLTLESRSVDITGIMNGTTPDIELRREDVLSIPSRYDLKEEYYVRITGEVNIPGSYAFAENLSVADLILKAGGFKDAASNSYIEIARRVRNDVSGKVAEIINLEVDANLNLKEDDAKVILQPFDHIFIRRSPGFQRERIVEVDGEVFYPGEFALSDANERISDLIRRAGGLNQFAYPKGATLIRRTEYYEAKTESELKEENLRSVVTKLQREGLSLSEAEEIALERIEKRLLDKEEAKVRMEEKEKQTLASRFRAERLQDVSVGDTALVQYEFKEQELIGINLEAILASPGSAQDLILEEGDIISIPKELQTVRMRGEVLFPTTARFQDFRGFRSYISRAGGFTEDARRGKSYVVYANGDVQRTRKFLFLKFYPHIEPGAEIIVPKRPERQPMTAQAWIGLATSMATLALLINNLTN
ncbi:MAG: polysaccharide biosynthesis protein [Mongoliibacter sp.]|uniref:SLBB domain-containing protein n=1 Tax=Mongoliibacter sp. TaxID=2022438 RepID=UPI0012F41BF5|nr:SLBB domain-containing protein [Mongoliibacter sp.]TVP43485.1 MAG: polysaccharide biosynthesis protein [Mongoliibacter sp.]